MYFRGATPAALTFLSVALSLQKLATPGLVHHKIVIETTTRLNFQQFLNDLKHHADNIFPPHERIHIIYDDARPHLRRMVPDIYDNRCFTLTLLPPYLSFLNPTEQAHSAFKAHVKMRWYSHNYKKMD